MTLLSSLILTTGLWRAALLTPGGELPFQMKIEAVNSTYTLTVINGDEQMLLDEVTVKGDSLIVRFPVYESELRLKIVDKDRLEGDFINLTRVTHASIRMTAQAGDQPRFPLKSTTPVVNVTGRWSVQFSPGGKDSSNAIGVFTWKALLITTAFFYPPSTEYLFTSSKQKLPAVNLTEFFIRGPIDRRISRDTGMKKQLYRMPIP
jgi:hypothetical protein